ncbi:hypothetical protein LINPERHAP2_LOCUS610 [Linum perenne]
MKQEVIRKIRKHKLLNMKCYLLGRVKFGKKIRMEPKGLEKKRRKEKEGEEKGRQPFGLK